MTTKTGWLSINSPRPTMKEFERIIKKAEVLIASRIGEIPDKVKLEVRPDFDGKRSKCSGYFQADAYKDKRNDKLVAAISLSPEQLNRPLLDIIETIVHEVLHAFNHWCGINDCSANDRHNGDFKKACDKIGLITKTKDELTDKEWNNIGHGFTSFSDELRELVINEWKPDADAWNLYRVENPPKAKKKSHRRTSSWECGTNGSVAAGTEFDATCNECESQFVETS